MTANPAAVFQVMTCDIKMWPSNSGKEKSDFDFEAPTSKQGSSGILVIRCNVCINALMKSLGESKLCCVSWDLEQYFAQSVAKIMVPGWTPQRNSQ
jgi:hypothetical protein